MQSICGTDEMVGKIIITSIDKFNIRKMKTQILLQNCFGTQTDIHMKLLPFLADEYAFRNNKRFARLDAFNFLSSQSQQTNIVSSGEGKLNSTQLAKKWGWSRFSVTKFIAALADMNVVDIKSVGSEKIVSIKPEVIMWHDSSLDTSKRIRADSFPSQTPSSHFSSSGTKGTSSLDKKFLEK